MKRAERDCPACGSRHLGGQKKDEHTGNVHCSDGWKFQMAAIEVTKRRTSVDYAYLLRGCLRSINHYVGV